MPQNSYSNKDLSRFERKPSRPQDMEILSEVPRDDVAAMMNEPSVESLLAAARGTLGRANKLAAETGSADIARIPQRMRNLSPDIVELGQDGQATGNVERGVDLPSPIDMMYGASTPLMAASAIPSPASPALGALAGLLQAPRAAESAMQGNYGDAAMEGAGAALVGASGPIFSAIGKGFRAAKGAAGNAVNRLRQGSFPSTVRGGTASTEIPYAGLQQAQNPNQVLSVARDVAFENGDDLAKVLKPQGKDSAAALLRLAGSGAEGRGAQAMRAGQETAASLRPFERAGIPQRSGLDPADFMGERTTGTGFETPQIFLDDVAGKNPYPLPNSSRYMSEVDNLTAGLSDEPFDLVDDVAAAQVAPNARDVDMLVSGVTPQQQAAQASSYAADPFKRKTPSPKRSGKGKKQSLKSLQGAITPMADDVLNAFYQAQE